MFFSKNSPLFFYLTLFIIFVSSSGFTQKSTSEKKIPIEESSLTNKYRLSAKIIPRQPLFRLKSSSPLTWLNNVQSTPSSWSENDGNYNWEASNHEKSIDIPLQNNFGAEGKTLKSLDEIQVEYQDFFSKNPAQLSLEMSVLENDSSSLTKSKSNWIKKKVTTESRQFSSAKIKENLFATSIKKKNEIYLIKRELGLSFDPNWRYVQDKIIAKNHGDHAVFQKRFHMDLKSIEFIDIVFRDNVTQKDLHNFRCNFQVAHTESAKERKLVAHYQLAHGFNYIEATNQILIIEGKKTIRFNIGDYVRNAYKNRNVVFLEEMIIFLPGLVENVISKKPIQLISFYEDTLSIQPIPDSTLNVTSAPWIKKNTSYLIKREIGFSTPSNWRYFQNKKFSFFERTLHKDLHKITNIDFVLNNKIKLPKKMYCQLRLGFSDHPFPRKTINCDVLSKEIININGKRLLRIKLHDLVHKFYAQGKKRVFLEELIFYLEGPINYYVENKILKTIRYFKLPQHGLTKTCFSSLELCSRTEFLSQNHKRYIVNMEMMNKLISADAKLISLILKIKPQNEKSSSGFKLKSARATLRTKNNQLLSNAGKDLVKRWGGPFDEFSRPKESIERVSVNSFFSFKNMVQTLSYETGKSLNADITAFSSKNSLHRLRKNNDGIHCDFIFLSKDANLFLELTSVGPFLENRLVTFYIKTDGPFNLVPVNPLISWSQTSDSIQFQLKKGTTPKFKINASSDFNLTSLKDRLPQNSNQVPIKSISTFEIPGLVNFKKIIVRGLPPINQDLTISFSKLNSISLKNKAKRIKRGLMEIITQNPFDRWNVINSGLVLEGTGKWIELNWKFSSRLHKNSMFILKTSDNANSVLSTEIIPFFNKEPLQSITGLLNQPISLGSLAQKKIDSLKVRLKFNERPYRLVLKEIALFESISASTNQIIDLASFFQTSVALTPANVNKFFPAEVSIKKGQLKANILSIRNNSQTLDWYTDLDQRLSQIKWIKIKYLVSPSIQANNPCWLKLFFLSSNQKFKKTVCTKSYDGEIRIPFNNYFADKDLKSIRWIVQMESKKYPMPPLVTIDLKMSISGLIINTIRNNTSKTTILEVDGKEVSPIFLKNLSAKNVAHIDSWWDLGVISTNPNFDFENNLRSSFNLSTHNLFLENTNSANRRNSLILQRQSLLTPISPEIKVATWWQLLITFISLIILWWGMKKKSQPFLSLILNIFRFLKIEKYPHLYLLLALAVYFFGLITSLRPFQNHFYTMGAIIFSLASYSFAKINFYQIADFLPSFLEKFFTQKETLLASLFLFFLSIAALLKMATFDRLAEQVTGIGFIMLFTLIFLRVFGPLKKVDEQALTNNNKDLENKPSNA
jgi:hypothetical protein